MDRAEALDRVATARSGHLATVGPSETPHVVVVTFAVVGEAVVTAVDHKPKTTTRLQRLVNIERNPKASLLVDHYENEWDALWWVRIDGTASSHAGGEVHSSAVEALAAKYEQYADRAPDGPVIALSIDRVSFWESTP